MHLQCQPTVVPKKQGPASISISFRFAEFTAELLRFISSKFTAGLRSLINTIDSEGARHHCFFKTGKFFLIFCRTTALQSRSDFRGR